MDNELILRNNFFKRNYKWLLPVIILLVLLFTLLLRSISVGEITTISHAYNEDSLFEKAIEKANKNVKSQNTIGYIKNIDQLAILEGNIIYSNNNNSVQLSVRIKGTKGNGKLDISANKKGKEWDYKKIAIRTRNPKQEIKIIE
jgi:hypothetical protein